MSSERQSLEDMTLVILAGGMGLRLREETERVPKPLVSIGEKPMLWHIMKLYRHYGLRHFVVCLGYKGWLIKEYFLRYREHVSDFTLGGADDGRPVFHNGPREEDWEITLAETGFEDATGSRLRQVQDYIRGDTFMCTYGDGLGAVEIGRLLDFHHNEGRIGTVTGVRPQSRYGEMRVEGTRAVEFNEKPTLADGFVNGGFFVFERDFFNWLSDDPSLFFEREPMQKLAREGELAVFPHDGYWLGMDTYRDFRELNDVWSTGDAPWKVWSD
jgi:glucose-1-phosphate cytidylyltransferase